MKYPVFAIRDVHTGFMSPTIELNENVAKRNFAQAVNNPDRNVMNFEPKDFDLYQIGFYETDTGILQPLDLPELVVTGVGVIGAK